MVAPPGDMVVPNPLLGNVSLAKVIGRYCPSRTVLPLVKLFNDRVLEQGTGYAFPGRNLNACR
ncbi:hypothetical protein [Microseira wollei]|uniref:Uncharacterized protein n=1 Tax=Microseira wollei NIES-4236 TaxID=2530354 RepID=A0AAV3X854_9CYAN|nr:hypothetical protein [Microseira wollei]GET38573.1 hypothetical protein MiSe_33310 [Microseira wollei NIES-4236]